jgi:hypothetical protein
MNYDMKPFLPKGTSRWKGPCCNLKRKHESNIYEEKHYSLVNCKFPMQYDIRRHIAVISFHDVNVTTLIKNEKESFGDAVEIIEQNSQG